jgi:hypothetical protein
MLDEQGHEPPEIEDQDEPQDEEQPAQDCHIAPRIIWSILA